MAATPNPSSEPALSHSPSSVPLSGVSSGAPSQTGSCVDETVSERLAQALAQAQTWVVAGHASKWPQLFQSFLVAKRTLEQTYRPQKSSSSVSLDLRKELSSFRILLYRALTTSEGALRGSRHIPQVLESGMLVPRACLIARS